MEDVNPCYSSFIGNIQQGFVDATNASIEIGRRGLHKYKNGTFMPDTREQDIATLESRFGKDVDFTRCSGWADMYKALTNRFEPKEFAYRLRTAIDEVKRPYRLFSMDACMSGVVSLQFT